MANGSIFFNGFNSYAWSPSDAQFSPRTGDYTVEWWQLQGTAGGSLYPKVFSLNSPTTASFSVGMELGALVLTENNTTVISTSVSPWQDTWTHIAVSRKSGSVYAFQDGKLLAIATSSSDINNQSDDFLLGSASGSQGGTYFRGNITDFHFVKGSAKYSGSVVGTRYFYPGVGVAPMPPHTKLLLNVPSGSGYLADSSGLGNVVFQFSGSYNDYYPTPIPTPTPTPTATPTPTPTPSPTPMGFEVQAMLYRSPEFPLGGEKIIASADSFHPGDKIDLVATQEKYSFDCYEVWPPNMVEKHSDNSYLTTYGFTASSDVRTTVIINETASITPEGNTWRGIKGRYR